jgi:membrane protein implicated in regulation of membrane protease activity
MMALMAMPLFGLGLFLLLPWQSALPIYVILLLNAGYYHRAMMKSRKLRVTTGREGMLGQDATVISWEASRGKVRCDGEIWSARTMSGTSLAPGTRMEIIDVQGLELIVRPPGRGDTARRRASPPAPNSLKRRLIIPVGRLTHSPGHN